MKIKFHHILAIFLVTLFLDFDYEGPFIRLRIIDGFLLILLAVMIISAKSIKVINHPVVWCMYVFIFYIILNGFTKVDMPTVLKEGLQLVEYLFLLHLIAKATDESEKRKEFLNILFWGTGAVAIYSMVYHISRGVYSGYKDLDAAKHAFAFFALLAVIRYFSEVKRKNTNLLLLLISLLMVFLAGERKGWAGLVTGIIVFVLLQTKSNLSRRNLNAIVFFFAALIVLWLVIAFYISGNEKFHYINRQLVSLTDFVNHLISSSDDEAYASRSNEERIFMINYGMKLFYQYPLFGVGVDQFRSYMSEASYGLINHDAHNFYLKILVEDGTIGIFLYLLPLTIVLLNLLKKNRNLSPEIALGARIIIALFFLGAFVNLFLAGKALSWFYIILPAGMLMGLNKEIKSLSYEEEENEEEEPAAVEEISYEHGGSFA